jgi:hypothetical protein
LCENARVSQIHAASASTLALALSAAGGERFLMLYAVE